MHLLLPGFCSASPYENFKQFRDRLTRVDTYIGLFCFHTLVMDIEREYKRAPFLRLHISHARCVLRFFALWFLIAEAFPRSLNSLSSGDDMVWQRTETRGKAQRIWLNIPVLHIYIPGTWQTYRSPDTLAVTHLLPPHLLFFSDRMREHVADTHTCNDTCLHK